jgi:hypothetical protein
MTKLSRRVESALLVVVIVAGAMLLHGDAQGENAGCVNAMCKEISYFYWCKALNGEALQYQDCTWCFMTGRCDGGTNVMCNVMTDDPQADAIIAVTTICDCSKAPAVNAPIVEANATYSGKFKPLGINRYKCAQAGGG